MRRIDELHLKIPFYGSRKMADCLRREGKDVNRKLVQRLMRLMDIEGIAPKPSTTRPAAEHPVCPYLLRNVKICRVDQVWCADVTYIPMAHGFVYLVAIMDWYSRRVLAWRLSNTMDPGFCVDALQEALTGFGQPGIFNTDQGAQFTAEAFTDVLIERGVKISMDGKGRFIDNIFVERLWRSVKYEEVYLMRTRPSQRPAQELDATSTSTISSVLTKRWDTEPLMSFIERFDRRRELVHRRSHGMHKLRVSPRTPLEERDLKRGSYDGRLRRLGVRTQTTIDD